MRIKIAMFCILVVTKKTHKFDTVFFPIEILLPFTKNLFEELPVNGHVLFLEFGIFSYKKVILPIFYDQRSSRSHFFSSVFFFCNLNNSSENFT